MTIISSILVVPHTTTVQYRHRCHYVLLPWKPVIVILNIVSVVTCDLCDHQKK